MSSATRLTVATFGTLAGLAGIEHGIGEILQGNQAPDHIVIASWPDTAFFRIVAGEPALTIVPNLLLTGILAIIVSLIVLVWATLLVQRKHGGLILMLLSLLLLLVGGGFGPPLLGMILGLAAGGINASFPWLRAHLGPAARLALSAAWRWSFMAALIAWLLMMPGSLLLDSFVGVDNPERLISMLIVAAFGLLLLTIGLGFVHDIQQEPEARLRPAATG